MAASKRKRPERELERRLARRLLEGHPEDAARALETLSDEQSLALLSGLAPEAVVAILPRIASHRAAHLLAGLPRDTVAPVVTGLGLEPAAHMLRRLDPPACETVLASLDERTAHPLRTLLSFAEGSAGSIMDPFVLALPGDTTVKQAEKLIRESPERVRYNLYVVDRDHRLTGVLTLRDLLLADDADRLGDIANRDVRSIVAEADRRAVLVHPAWRVAHSLPVVDESGVYLGAVRYRTLRRLEEEFRKRSAGQVTTGEALGELFWAGLSGAANTFVSAVAGSGSTAEGSGAPGESDR